MKTTQNCIRLTVKALLAVVLFTSASSVHAQEGVFKPYAFIGIQGGGQTSFTDFNNFKLITPTASIYLGMQFTPAFGARLHANGLWNKGGVKAIDQKYSYNYETTNLDAMINLVNLFSKRDYHPWNVYLIGGVGMNYAWNNDDAEKLGLYLPLADKKNSLSHNFRVGAMLDYNISRKWSVNLEVSGNNLNDRYNSKFSGNDDWQLTAQLGVTYKFGVRQKVKGNSKDADTSIGDPITSDIETEAIPANTNVGLAKSEPEQKPALPAVVEPQNISRSIFFTIRSTEVASLEQAKLEEVATWLKEHPTAKVTVTGYADKGTGTTAVNARYAKMRAESVTKELTKKYGIDASRITTDSKGDIVQPFPNNNDQNRVTIVIAEE